MSNRKPEVRVRFDRERGASVLDLEIQRSRVSALIAAVADAARPLHAAIQWLELRPRKDMLDAHIVVASEHASDVQGTQSALVGVILEAIQAAVAEPSPV